MSSLRLPRYIFLTGAPGVGKTALANAIADHVPTAIVRSFESPLRMALASTFFDGDFTRDFTRNATEPVSAGVSIAQYLTSYEAFLCGLFDDSVLGRIALADTAIDEMIAQSTVFDDAVRPPRLQPFVDMLSRPTMLQVEIIRPGFGAPPAALHPDVQHITLVNDTTVPDLLSRFFTSLMPIGEVA